MEQNSSKDKSTDSSGFSRGLKNFNYMVWSTIGVAVLTLMAVAVFGSGTWVENLNLTKQPEVAQQQDTQGSQTPPPQQQQQQPTQEQLDCVSDEVGEERFTELQQGQQPNQEETAAIQTCLSS
ncbi:MAG: hypothetical protein U5K77_03535 [Candidatus Saccharibacteria bacterium]|nr:hypothetical protein [Candidatus Saccharibacteria bacterium]